MPTIDIETIKWITMAYFSGTFILAIFNFNLFLFHKKLYLKRWLQSWLTISVGYIVLFISLETETNFLFGIFSLFMIGSSYLFLLASGLFLKFKLPKYAIYLLVVSSLFILLFTILYEYVAWSVLIGYLVNGYYFLYIGYQFLRKDKHLSRITGALICMFSLISFIYPFLSIQPWFSPWGYMAFGMVGLLIGMSLIQIHFHNQREEFIQLNKRLKYLVNHDTLTDIYNRSFINVSFDNIMNNNVINVGLLFVDLNNFKLINDQYGHKKGDEILIQVTKILSRFVKTRAHVCRFGGDEFVIIMYQTNLDELHQLRDDIIKVGQESLTDDIHIQFAVGAALRDDTSQDIHDLLDVAEREMYLNKSEQKNK